MVVFDNHDFPHFPELNLRLHSKLSTNGPHLYWVRDSTPPPPISMVNFFCAKLRDCH